MGPLLNEFNPKPTSRGKKRNRSEARPRLEAEPGVWTQRDLMANPVLSYCETGCRSISTWDQYSVPSLVVCTPFFSRIDRLNIAFLDLGLPVDITSCIPLEQLSTGN